MILAAGFGTRFRPITYFLPKPLIPLHGKPLIAHAVDRYLAAGVDEIVVNLHHLPELIERYLVDTYGPRFHFSHEPEILGTGGGIRKVRSLLESQDDFFVVNGDTIQDPPYDALRRARQGALAALTLRHPPAGDRFTAVWFENARITGFGQGSGEPLMFSGSSCISRRIFDLLPDQPFSGIVEDVYMKTDEPIAGVIDDGPWFDIGSPGRYMQAVRGNEVGARSIVEGTLENSVVWDDCRIGPNVRLTNCIVAHGVELAGPMELANALICNDHPAIPRDGPYEFRNGLVMATI